MHTLILQFGIVLYSEIYLEYQGPCFSDCKHMVILLFRIFSMCL